MNLTIDSNVAQITKKLKRAQRVKIPSATRNALNSLAKQTANNLKEKLPLYIKNPTPFTKKGIRFQETDKSKLKARVGFLSKSWNGFKGGNMNHGGRLPGDYMNLPWKGGTRLPDKRVITVPAKSQKLNKFGNLRRGLISQYLGDTAKYFQGIPKGIRDKEANGIWKRMGKKGQKNIVMMIAYEEKTEYKKIYPFGQQVSKSVRDNFRRIFEAQLTNVLAKEGLL